ncbi:PREDICTED: uncharacterized protein LOC104810247 [Tarenaya hassleriana]|uniref:uncharacterized protein LOC104810247 n=1 Tax=Tarenaya hassleriana TaxID=28532 RepID=UPI00053C4C92|nr:PREDICTED: uncharacterized protein LOC104810247 [Tarenaya hassleriana]
MEALLSSSPIPCINLSNCFSDIVDRPIFRRSCPNIKFQSSGKSYNISSTLSPSSRCTSSSATSSPPSSYSSTSSSNRHWRVRVDTPPQGLESKVDFVDYYVEILSKVLGNERDAQMSMFDASYDTHFGFCCDIDEDSSRKLACLPEVLSVRPELDYNWAKRDYSFTNQLDFPLFPEGSVKHWKVRIEKPGVEIVTKAQMVDHCVKLLSKVLRNEKDAQMCLYHISWQSIFGFCCELDDECIQELAGVPGVLDVVSDNSFESPNKDYGGNAARNSKDPDNSDSPPVKTKKLFITGLSFYTSEKTLRAAFEGFGELVEVKIIMDKISKRSKGYAFVEYTTEKAASAALKEMNGKIINGWMIVVDVAKTKPSTRNRSISQQHLNPPFRALVGSDKADAFAHGEP